MQFSPSHRKYTILFDGRNFWVEAPSKSMLRILSKVLPSQDCPLCRTKMQESLIARIHLPAEFFSLLWVKIAYEWTCKIFVSHVHTFLASWLGLVSTTTVAWNFILACYVIRKEFYADTHVILLVITPFKRKIRRYTICNGEVFFRTGMITLNGSGMIW